MRKSGQAYSAQQLTFNQSAEMAAVLNKMVNASRTVIGDTFGLPPSAISPTSEGIQTFLQANAGSLTPAQVNQLKFKYIVSYVMAVGVR